MWSRFWDSFGANETAESESQSSDPLSSHHYSSHPRSQLHAISPEPSASLSQLQGFPEITPNESASMVANNEDALSNVSSQRLSRQHPHRYADDGTFAFKFTTDSGKTHRFTGACSYTQLVETVRAKVADEHTDDDGSDWLTVSYLDDENDQVLITSDNDVVDAVQLARKTGQDRVKLFVHDKTRAAGLAAASTTATATPPATPSSPLPPRVATPDIPPASPSMRSDSSHRRRHASKRRSRLIDSDDESEIGPNQAGSGLPQELMLPAAIAFLGVVILGVFAYSRVNPRHR